MPRFLPAIGGCLLLATMLSSAQTEQSVPTLDNESSGSWFVELASPPTTDGTAVATLEREEDAFHAAAAGAGVRYSEGRHFRKLWNGLTVRASAGDVPKLRALPGVQSVYPVVKVDPPAGRGAAGRRRRYGDGDPHDGRRYRAECPGPDRARRHGGGDGHRHRLRPSRPRRLFRSRAAASPRASTSWATTSMRARPTRRSRCPTRIRILTTATVTARTSAASSAPTAAVKGVAPGVTFHAYRVFGCEGHDDRRDHARRDGNGAGRRRRRVEHEHRQRAGVAAIPDGQGAPTSS